MKYGFKPSKRDSFSKVAFQEGTSDFKCSGNHHDYPEAKDLPTFWLLSILMASLKYCLLLLISFIFIGCENYPKDPEKTLEKVKNGTMRVGYSENPPWVVETDHVPTGIEPELIKAFAKTLNAKIEWKNDTEQNLFEDLMKKRLHLIVAGTTDDSPWKTKVGLTRPFFEQQKKKQVMAVIQGENAFIVHLEKFLYGQEQEIKERMKQ